MANRPQTVTVPPPATYTRTDFAALRARIQGIPAATIARRFYDVEDSAVPAEADAVERHLTAMRDELVRLALLNGSPALAEHLCACRCGSTAKRSSLRLRCGWLRTPRNWRPPRRRPTMPWRYGCGRSSLGI